MGSCSKKIRRTPARDLRTTASQLVKHATKKHTRSVDCFSVQGERFVEAVVSGWKIRCALRLHPRGFAPTLGMGSGIAALPGDPVEHWHLVMQLHPYKRFERADDWAVLADFVARVASLTGYEGAYVHAVAPLDQRPHEPHHFLWHTDDGEQITPEERRVLGRRIAMEESTA